VETRLDTRRVEAFARRMTGQLNEAMLVLLTSIAHQTGLFDVMAALPAATSEAIAAAAGLDERYVREWLSAMVVGRIVDYDGVRGTYRLPPEHAASLTRAAGAANLARRALRVAALAELETEIVDRFRRGGGLPSTAFARLQALKEAEIDEQEFNLIAALATQWPEIVARLDEGIDVLVLRASARPNVDRLAARFPASRFTLTVANDPIAIAAQDLIIAWEVLAAHGDPMTLLRAVRSSLRPNGSFLCIEMAASSNLADNVDRACAPLLYATSTMQNLPLSLATGKTALGIMWGDERARQMLAEAGFGSISACPLGADQCQVCLVTSPA